MYMHIYIYIYKYVHTYIHLISMYLSIYTYPLKQGDNASHNRGDLVASFLFSTRYKPCLVDEKHLLIPAGLDSSPGLRSTINNYE